jgi:hypothetical protein
MEVDTACTLLWANLFGWGYEDYMRDMVWLGNGASFQLYGFSGVQNAENVLWFRTDPDGNVLCDMNHYGLLTGQPLTYTETQPFLAISSSPLTAANWLCTTSPLTWSDTILCVLGAVDDPQSGLRLEIGPNPATDVLQVRWEEALGREVRLGLLDLRGRKLLEAVVPAGGQEARLDLTGVPAGLYLLDCRSETFRTSVRVVVGR